MNKVMTNVMVDLETMSTRSNAAIVSIGAIFFDPGRDVVGSTFYANVNLQSCLDAGLHVEGDTVMWWLQQSDSARKALNKERYSLPLALQRFNKWLGLQLKDQHPDLKLWGNGAAFDNTILTSAYQAVGLTPPWKFWNDRCYRTLKQMSPIEATRVGTHHNAVDDAHTQAAHLMDILKTVPNLDRP